MKVRLFAAAAVSAAVIAVACSKSSTAPGLSLAGTWQVTWSNVAFSTIVVPSPMTLTLTRVGNGYSAIYPDFDNQYGYPSLIYGVYTDTSTISKVVVAGDSVKLYAGQANGGCYALLAATATDSTMQGTVLGEGNGCASGALWSFTATKQ